MSETDIPSEFINEIAVETKKKEGKAGRCHACGCNGPNPGTEPLSIEEIDQAFLTLRPNFWSITTEKKSLYRTFICRNFKAAIDFINAAAAVAEREDIQHHPDLYLMQYRTVEVRIFTHAANGLTKYDFMLAKELESIPIDYSPKWLKDHPEISS